ncbi:MAG: type IX secretion system PorP/SprF family membrane protein [Parvicellaceae bacterium]|jgi:type IX secretion system PorP/SprF family membrane protein
MNIMIRHNDSTSKIKIAMSKKIFYLLLLLMASGEYCAQQDALYSQYMFNPFAINPAYAGSRDAISGVILHRNQWAGLDGAPSTSSIALHSPFKGKHFSLGINAFAETIGPSTNQGAFLTYAYRVKMPVGKLAFAIRGGMYSSRFDKGRLNYNNPADQHNTGGVFTAATPTFDFGAYYNTNHLFFGASVSHIAELGSSFDDVAETQLELNRHYIGSFGGALEITRKLVYKPSIIVKYVAGAPLSLDINSSFLFNKVFWLGASYRTSKSVVLVTELNVTDFLRIGYSYDIVFNQLQRYNNGSHELFIGFDFGLKKQKSVSPRYL